MSNHKPSFFQFTSSFSKKHKVQIKNFVTLILLVTSIPLALFLTYMPVRLWSKAAIVTTQVFFNPQNGTMPPNGTMKVMVDAKTEKVGFIRVAITFDPSKVRLAQDVQTTASLRQGNTEVNPAPARPFCQGTETCIMKTPYQTANSTGRIMLVLGLKPGDTAPTGIFELASLSFTPVSQTNNDSASIQVDVTDSQIVNIAPEEQNITSQAATYRLNPVAATPTPAPTTTPTPTPSPSPKPTTQPTTQPTAPPTAQPTTPPTPTVNLVFKLQGAKANTYPVTIRLKQGSAVVHTINASATYNATAGTYTATITGFNAGTYDIGLKTNQHLGRLFPAINLTGTGTFSRALTAKELLIGDVDGDNSIQIADIGSVISAWTASETPVTSTNTKFDLDFDHFISISDIGVIISNWVASEVSGENY